MCDYFWCIMKDCKCLRLSLGKKKPAFEHQQWNENAFTGERERERERVNLTWYLLYTQPDVEYEHPLCIILIVLSALL